MSAANRVVRYRTAVIALERLGAQVARTRDAAPIGQETAQLAHALHAIDEAAAKLNAAIVIVETEEIAACGQPTPIR